VSVANSRLRISIDTATVDDGNGVVCGERYRPSEVIYKRSYSKHINPDMFIKRIAGVPNGPINKKESYVFLQYL